MLLSMQATLDGDKKSDSNSYVVSMCHAYNAIRCDTTELSSHYLIIGWHQRYLIQQIRPIVGQRMPCL